IRGIAVAFVLMFVYNIMYVYHNFFLKEARAQEVADSDEPEEEPKKVVVGICAMGKKSSSRPMQEILTRLEEFEYIKTVVFSEKTILNDPVETWPLCDCLVSFHSRGFPLSKAIEYVSLREPLIINDLHMQYDIQDRRKGKYSMS